MWLIFTWCDYNHQNQGILMTPRRPSSPLPVMTPKKGKHHPNFNYHRWVFARFWTSCNRVHSMHSFAFGLFCSVLHLRGSSVSLYVLNLFILLLSNNILYGYTTIYSFSVDGYLGLGLLRTMLLLMFLITSLGVKISW